jgi:biopolymer transport protein ExbD
MADSDQSAQRLLFRRMRFRVRRQAAAAEEEEHQGGELNLVPYLDILVNTIIFLLATTAVALPLVNVLVREPSYVKPGPDDVGGDTALNLTVGISQRGFYVAGAGGLLRQEGSPPQRRVTVEHHDYRQLTRLAQKIKARYPNERRVVLVADRQVPYAVLIRTMDALRGTSTRACTGEDGCLFDQVSFGTGVM